MDYKSLSAEELRLIRKDSHNLDERIKARDELERRDREKRGEQGKERKWTRDQKIGAIVAVGTIILIILAAAVVPDIRNWFHLPQEHTSTTQIAPNLSNPNAQQPNPEQQKPEAQPIPEIRPIPETQPGPDQRRNQNLASGDTNKTRIDVLTGLGKASKRYDLGPLDNIQPASRQRIPGLWSGTLPGGNTTATYEFLNKDRLKVTGPGFSEEVAIWTRSGDQITIVLPIISTSGDGGARAFNSAIGLRSWSLEGVIKADSIEGVYKDSEGNTGVWAVTKIKPSDGSRNSRHPSQR